MSPKDPEAEFSSADFICPDSTCTMTSHPGTFQRRGTVYHVYVYHVQCWFSHGNWTTAYSRTKQLSRVNSPDLHQYFWRAAHTSLPHGPVWLLSCPPSPEVRRAVTSVKGEEGYWKKLLQALAICLSFLLAARRQVTVVTKTMIYSLAPLDVLNHLVPWIWLGRQPYVFSWVLLQIDSSGFNTNIMILISGSERTFYYSLWVNKASWLRMRRKWMLSERVLWLPWRAGWAWATCTCQPVRFSSHFEFKEY